MRRFGVLSLLVLVACVARAPASSLTAWLTPLAFGVEDGVSPAADVYALVGRNGTAAGVEAIRLDLDPAEFGVSRFLIDSAGFLNRSELDAENGALPSFRGVTIVDSFVVLPDGLAPLAATAAFEPTGIQADYTTSGGTLIGAQSQTTLAHLSVPAGETPTLPWAFGSAVLSDAVTTGDFRPIVYLAADFNGSGVIDLVDLGILGANFGRPGPLTRAEGDANADGLVDLTDLSILGAEFQRPRVAIPEPSAFGLAGLVLAGSAARGLGGQGRAGSSRLID